MECLCEIHASQDTSEDIWYTCTQNISVKYMYLKTFQKRSIYVEYRCGNKYIWWYTKRYIHAEILCGIDIWQHMIVSTENAPPQKFAKSKITFLGLNSNRTNFSVWFCTMRYWKIWGMGFVGYRKGSNFSGKRNIYLCGMCMWDKFIIIYIIKQKWRDMRR